ncbi:hypothetical protein DSECCO2_401040 [anaerobic digester metagenome]
MKLKRKLTALITVFSIFALTVSIGLPNLNATGPVAYTNHTKEPEISEITTVLIDSRSPKSLAGKFVGNYRINGVANLYETVGDVPIFYYYINMMDVVNLYSDGTHVILPDGKHQFKFGGNTVTISENSNKININGKNSFIGKIRYADSKNDKARYGFFLGSKITYDQTIKNFGTWVPAEAVDEVLDFGLRGLGGSTPNSFVNQAKFGIAVPAQYRVITPWQGLQPYKKQNVADIKYTQIKNELPVEIKSKIKESTVNNLLFGEDYSNIDNYDQVAKMIKAMFSGITPVAENMISYNNMSETELAKEFRRISSQKEEQFIDFYSGTDRSNSYAFVRVYFSGPEKKNGISFVLYPVKSDNSETPNFIFHFLRAIYPYEMAEYITKDSISAIDMNNNLSAPGNNKFTQHNIVQAHGKYKWFSGRLASDMREFNPRVTYFLLDNHPAMPEEMFSSSPYEVWNLTDMGVAGDNTQEREFRRCEGFYGRGYREDFFAFAGIPDAVKVKIGMKTIYDSVDYNFITISQKARDYDGTKRQSLEKCSNNPYETYGKLK